MDAAALRQRIAMNLAGVREHIEQAAGGREITLVCVTKYAQPAWLSLLLDAGAEHLAENLLPVAVDRFTALREAGGDFTAHLIGPQQSRKAKLIPGCFEWMQAVDSVKFAQLLQVELVEADTTINGLLQVNIANEPQKHGVSPETADSAYHEILETCPAIRLRGLMAVPPWPEAYSSPTEFEKGTRRYFYQMRHLFDKIAAVSPAGAVDTLSLGMSLDYLWAITEGATMVRVGSALFEGLEG